MLGESRVYQIYYSKDIRKKKKIYSDGIMLCEEKKTKIFTTEGELVLSVNNKSKPEPDEEYVINNAYVGKQNINQFSSTKKSHSLATSAARFSWRIRWHHQYCLASKSTIKLRNPSIRQRSMLRKSFLMD
jgi:hypothetical protein